MRKLIAALDSKGSAERDQARRTLEELGDAAVPGLRQALTAKPSLEVRRRIEAVLEILRPPIKRPQTLQAVRAVAVLEDIATSEARNLLQTLANGAPETALTKEAKASLKRLADRTSSPP